MFIKIALVLLLAIASQQAPEVPQAVQFNITGYIVGVVYGFFDSIDFYEAWNCSQGIITFYTNLTMALAKIKGNTGGLQGTINFLNVIITILNCTINELVYCGQVINELQSVAKVFYYMFVSPHYIEDLAENFIRCSPFFLYYYERMIQTMGTNSTASGYYTMLGIFDTVLLTTYARQIGSLSPDNCDLEGFRHSIWSPT